jgi:hypothetical protein
MMMISILLKAYALLLGPVFWPAALGCWGLSIACDIRWLRTRSPESIKSGRTVMDMFLLHGSMLVLGSIMSTAYFQATLRWKSGWPVAARVLEWLFTLLRFPAGSFEGRLYANSMSGPTSYPVNLDTLGLLLPLLVLTAGIIHLLLYAGCWRAAARGLGWLVAVMIPVILLRWILATGLFLALCDFVNYESQDLPIAPFFKPGMIAVLYLPFLAAAAVVLHRPLEQCIAAGPSASSPAWRKIRWLWIPMALLLLLIFWEPKGTPKNGRVLINTYHTGWSRTDRPYDREWYGAASGYNYACLKRLYEGFFDVEELTERITAEDLENASVLIIYDPNRAFTDEEIQAVREFVARGGGLFVIGDHTNVFGSSSHLNQILDGMGFLFRDDVLFDLDTDFFQLKDIPPMHPGPLHGMTFFKFRGPASLRSSSVFTRNLFTLGNAKSLRAIYSVNNFYPPPHDHPKMWTGDFAVAMSSRYGRGRVIGFADSTVFSNFEIFYPGKYEFLLNTVNWLNHADSAVTMPLKRISLPGALLILGLLLYRSGPPRRALTILTATGLLVMAAWTAARLGDQARTEFPNAARPMRYLFFAAEPEDEALTLRAFVTDTPYEQKYDVFIQWVLRTDVFPGFHLRGKRFDNAFAGMVRNHEQVDTGLALIAARPDHLELLDELTPGPLREAERRLLMFAGTFSWQDVQPRLAAVLSANGMEQARAAWPDSTARIEDAGRRTAVVFQAERFSDRNMGFSEKVTPTEAQKTLYAEQFELLDWLFEASSATVDGSDANSTPTGN